MTGGTQQFFEEVQARGQGERVRIFEYFREGWTFHGKGLWYTPAGQSRPILTMIGSPNFGTPPRSIDCPLSPLTDGARLLQAVALPTEIWRRRWWSLPKTLSSEESSLR